MPNSFTHWIQQQRSSTRLAYILQMLTRTASALLSLVWTPLLIGTMGKGLYGTFLSFQSVATLGSLGDLGMGGVVSIETSRLLGQKEQSRLQEFLAAARAAFLLMAVCVSIVFVLFAPWLPGWLGFQALSGTGSLHLLFIVGGLGAGLVIVGSYITNLNYGAVNLTWPIIPGFALVQFSLLLHWVLASSSAPLWLQYLPYVVTTALATACGWVFVRRSYPNLSRIFPVKFEWAQLRDILAKSVWVYVYCIGSAAYVVTDRLIINAGFGAEQVPSYQLNFKLCELALFVIGSASLVSIPKIAVWIASSDPSVRERGARETQRLNRFQTFLGCIAVLTYLAINDAFMYLWLGEGYQVPLSWQAAFAANLAVTAAGYAGYDVAARCGPEGLRFGAITVAVSVLVKVVISYCAMLQNSILLIAVSTVVSQSIVVLVSAWFACRTIRASWWRLAGIGWCVSLALVAFATIWKSSLWMRGVYGKLGFVVAALLLLWIAAKLLGLNSTEVRAEIGAVRSIFQKPGLARPENSGP